MYSSTHEFKPINTNPEYDLCMDVVKKLASDIMLYYEDIVLFGSLFVSEMGNREDDSKFTIDSSGELTEKYIAYIRSSDSSFWRVDILIKFSERPTKGRIENFELTSIKSKSSEQESKVKYRLSYDHDIGFIIQNDNTIITLVDAKKFIEIIHSMVFNTDGYHFITETDNYESRLNAVNESLDRGFVWPESEVTTTPNPVSKFMGAITTKLFKK